MHFHHDSSFPSLSQENMPLLQAKLLPILCESTGRSDRRRYAQCAAQQLESQRECQLSAAAAKSHFVVVDDEQFFVVAQRSHLRGVLANMRSDDECRRAHEAQAQALALVPASCRRVDDHVQRQTRSGRTRAQEASSHTKDTAQQQQQQQQQQ